VVVTSRDELVAMVITFVREIRLERTGEELLADLDETTELTAEGVEMDSLDTAELAARLEDELGRDPYSEGVLPATIGDVADFYLPGSD
jgi:acyl carrier protein